MCAPAGMCMTPRSEIPTTVLLPEPHGRISPRTGPALSAGSARICLRRSNTNKQAETAMPESQCGNRKAEITRLKQPKRSATGNGGISFCVARLFYIPLAVSGSPPGVSAGYRKHIPINRPAFCLKRICKKLLNFQEYGIMLPKFVILI